MPTLFGHFDFSKFFLLFRRFLILTKIGVFFLFFFGFHDPSMDPSAEEMSAGIHVPSVSAVRQIPSNSKHDELDKDITCPICFQTMKDAFSTSCGHSFCYMCIMTHLNNKKNCPWCGLYLTSAQVFPNFLLNKVSNSFTQQFI